MPFKKLSANDYVSPSGRHFTLSQVRLYYATGGFKKNAIQEVRRGRRGKK
jgi:hypothetical protein